MTLSKMAEIDLNALRSGGFNPTDLQVVMLNELAKKIEGGETNFDCATMPRVAFVGENVVLHEPTIGSLCWWSQYGSKASENEDDSLIVYFFMLAHAIDLGVLNELKTSKQILDAVSEWMKIVDATEKELWAGLMWVKYGNETAADVLNDADDGKEENIRKEDSLISLLLEAAVSMGVNPEELKTQTIPNLDSMLIRANRRAGFEIKPSIGKYYIEYKQLIKQIENSGKVNNEVETDDEQ